jgi:hypothetical protein
MLMDITHLTALQTRLANETDYLAKAKNKAERELRKVWIAQIEKEIACEKQHLGLKDVSTDLSNDELMRELGC